MSLLMLFLVFSCSQLTVKRYDRLSIVQGLTNHKEVEFSVLAPKQTTLKFELRTDQGVIISPDEVRTVERDHSKYAVHKILFLRDPQVDYNLYVFEGARLVDQRLIGRFPRNTSEVRIALAANLNDNFSENFKIWNELFKKNPDYLLLLGDNVYATINASAENIEVTQEALWDRYVETRLYLPLFFQQKLVPIHAIWNDYDYGHKEVFLAFWGQDLAEESYTRGHGIGGLLNIGDFNLYFLDARTFRSTTPDGKHLGADQHTWLVSKLAEEPNPSFIIKGDPFFGGTHPRDSFEGKHPSDFVQFTADLGKISTPFIFLSADRSCSEIMQFPRGLFGRPSFEITAGPLHAPLSPEQEQPNPWQVVQEKDHHNFVMISNFAKDDHWFMDIESIGENGEVFFRREVAVFIKDLQNNLSQVRKKRRHGGRRYQRVRRSRR